MLCINHTRWTNSEVEAGIFGIWRPSPNTYILRGRIWSGLCCSVAMLCMKVLLPLNAPFFRCFNSLFHSFEMSSWRESRLPRDAFPRKWGIGKPRLWLMLWPIAQKRATTRKRDRKNQILHKICHPLALVLGYYHFAFINRSVLKFTVMPEISAPSSLRQCKQDLMDNFG